MRLGRRLVDRGDMPDLFIATSQGQLGQKIGQMVGGNEIVIFVRTMEERGIEAGADEIPPGHDRSGLRVGQTMLVVISGTTDSTDPIDIGPATAIGIVRNPVPIAAGHVRFPYQVENRSQIQSARS